MSAAVQTMPEEPRVLRALPGRVRVHLPEWSGLGEHTLEARLRQIPGVRSAQANPLTRNVLIGFDPAATDQERVLDAVRAVEPPAGDAGAGPARPALPAARPSVLRERRGHHGRARIALPALEGNPALARQLVERLQQQPGVHRVTASALTSRLLVEYDSHQTDIEDFLAEVTGMELPDLPGQDQPSHPLDPAPLVQSATRTAGAGLGLGLLAARRLLGVTGPPAGAATAAQVAGVIGIVQGFPITRNGLRRLLGRDTADILFQGAAIVSLALSGSPLGLSVTGAEALRLLTEVVARRRAWQRYADRLGDAPAAHPGAVIRLEAGERCPLAGQVIEGTGTAIGRDGRPTPLAPGADVAAGSRVHGGPFVVALQGGAPFSPVPRDVPATPSLYDRYVQALGPASLAYAVLTAVFTRSLGRAFAALLLVTPRTSLIATEGANLGASARVLRAGVTVVGTRPHRVVRRPDLLLLDGPRVLTEGHEIAGTLPVGDEDDPADLLGHAAGVAAAAGAPWGSAFPAGGRVEARDGTFDGRVAAATIGGERYTLGPVADRAAVPAALRLRHRGETLLALHRAGEPRPRALFALRPRLARDVAELVATARRRGVALALIRHGDAATAQAVARRAGVALVDGDPVALIRARQDEGALVAFLSDSAEAGAAFAACDLAIGLSSGRSGRFPARADLLAPDLGAVAAIVEAGARREAAVRDGVLLSVAANAAGAVWGFRGAPGVEAASRFVYITALGALADNWLRLRGGERPRDALTRLADPRPERWGRRDIAGVLRDLHTGEGGLTEAEAETRRREAPRPPRQHELVRALGAQLRSPLTLILAAGAGFSLVLGAAADVAMIGAMIVANAAIGAWQERQAGRAAEALAELGTATARVLRDGRPVTIPASAVVPGDIVLLAPGDRVAADARVVRAHGLEVDEAALTGESLPVAKAPTGGTAASRVVLEGSDVTVGTGRAAVVAVGERTRLGATAAALALDETTQSPLGQRLGRLLRQFLPLAVMGGALVVGAGVARGRPLGSSLAIGGSLALAAVPEGLPLLAGVGEAGVARRLAGRQALVRRLAAVEALGRVDVACTDKTGTLTEGKLALRVVASPSREALLPGPLAPGLRHVLLTAALASPHPDAPDAGAHPTDVAVVRGAEEAGLDGALRAPREAEAGFDPVRGFHAAVVEGRLRVKGAAEALAPRCAGVRRSGKDVTLDDAGRAALLDRARRLAERGLRVLLVAEGPADTPPADPQGLVALGFVGLSDPLRPGVPAAVRRCRDAGVRVLMLTGDHPATARTIAREAGLLDGRETDGEVLTGSEIAELENGDLDAALARAAVVARITPLDKVRIVESLKRRGHTVAMTGDGVNDAPALRLADVGVAMGRAGTEVARQAADVVLADDDFATLVEALVEGRSFWRNVRRALGLLLGGNLGELGLMVGASALGLAPPLIARQILAVNVITDALPALAVALQPPEHRHLAGLAREGAAALDAPLRREVLRRGAATAFPSIAAYGLALGFAGPAQASTVAFASIVATQLAQTLDAGRTEGGLSRAVVGAVVGSTGLLVAALVAPPLAGLLGLAAPSPLGWLLIAGAAGTAIPLGRALTVPAGVLARTRWFSAPALPAPAAV